MIASAHASLLIYRYRVTRRWRIERARVSVAVRVGVAAPLALFVLLAWPWDVIGSVFSDIAKRVRDAVVWVANQLVAIVVAVVNDVWSFAGDLASGIADALNFVVGIGESAFGLLSQVWNVWIPNAVNLAIGAARGLVDTLGVAVTYLRDHVAAVVVQFAGQVAGVFSWIWGSFWPLIVGQLQAIASWVTNTVQPFIIGLARAWVDVLSAGLSALTDAARTAIDIANSFGSLMVRWFTEGVHFMLFVLTHPFDWWRLMARDAFTAADDYVNRGIVTAADTYGGDFLDSLGRWLG